MRSMQSLKRIRVWVSGLGFRVAFVIAVLFGTFFRAQFQVETEGSKNCLDLWVDL